MCCRLKHRTQPIYQLLVTQYQNDMHFVEQRNGSLCHYDIFLLHTATFATRLSTYTFKSSTVFLFRCSSSHDANNNNDSRLAEPGNLRVVLQLKNYFAFVTMYITYNNFNTTDANHPRPSPKNVICLPPTYPDVLYSRGRFFFSNKSSLLALFQF